MLSDRPGSASLRFFSAALFWLILPGVVGLTPRQHLLVLSVIFTVDGSASFHQ